MKYGSHSYYDVSDLNAKWDQALPAVAGLGGCGNGILSGNTLAIRGLGQTTDAFYPWREESADTKALQESLNLWLTQHGYQAIATDGYLGPGTCGAIEAMCDVQGCVVPGTCQDSTPPRKAGTTTSTTTVRRASLGGGPNWMLIGGAIGLAAIGVAVMTRRKAA